MERILIDKVFEREAPITLRHLAYTRKFRPKVDYRGFIFEGLKTVIIVTFVLSLVLGWSLALSAPTCSHDYQTNITSCV